MGGKRTAESRVRGGTQDGVLAPRVPWRLLRRVFSTEVRGESAAGELRCCLRTFRPDSSARIASGPKSERVGDPAGLRPCRELIACRCGCGRGPSVDRGELRALFAGEVRSAMGSVCCLVGLAPTLASSRCRATRLETPTKECRRRASLWQWGAFAVLSAWLRRWRRVAAVRPVLKHGPRSAGGARVFG